MCIHGALRYDCPESCPIHPHTSERIGGAHSLTTRIHRCERWNIHGSGDYTIMRDVRLDDDDVRIPDADRERLRHKFGACPAHGRAPPNVPESPLVDDAGHDSDSASDALSDTDRSSLTSGSPSFAAIGEEHSQHCSERQGSAHAENREIKIIDSIVVPSWPWQTLPSKLP